MGGEGYHRSGESNVLNSILEMFLWGVTRKGFSFYFSGAKCSLWTSIGVGQDPFCSF